MDAERYRRLTELFEGALTRPRDERDAWLAEHCDDDALRAEVVELLADDEAGAFSDDDLARRRQDAEAALDAFVSADADEPAWRPDRVGRYDVVGVLGRGGMGVVYEALQPHPRRRVALKLVHPMLADAAARRRLEREADILARLQHPGIAQVFEAGSADLGHGEQPWFAMELVDGVDLRTWAAREGLDARARLELVARVADAVHHAHEHGVVHRDLKPDNVLVDARGQPKVLDFGVARASDTTALLTSMTTASGALMGTLAYMAPEQLDPSLGATGPWSDVYALGVIAYELLAGRRPYDVAGMSLSGAVTSITDGDAAPLRRIDTSLPLDAETIVGAALSAEIPNRYPSAAALADDIRRFLDDRPLSARPPSRVDRARRFARRNRVFVGGVAATLLALTLGGLVAVDFALKEQAQRQIADAQRLEADRRAWRANVALATDALNRGDQRAARGFVDTAATSDFAGWETELLASATSPHDLALPLGAAVRADPMAGSLALDDSGRIAAYPLGDGEVAAWDLDAGAELGRLADDEGSEFVRVAARMPGGRVFALSRAGRIVAWSPATGARETIARLTSPGAVNGLSVSGDGRRLAVSGDDLTLVDGGAVVTLDAGARGAQVFAHPRITTDGREVVVLERRGWTHQCARFDVDARARVVEHSTGGGATAVAANGAAVVEIDRSGVLLITGRDLGSRAGPFKRHLGRSPTSAAVSDDATLAATATELDVCLWSVDPPALVRRWSHAPLGPGAALGLRFSPGGDALLAAKDDTLVRWDLATLERPLAPRVVAPSPTWSYDACLSPDGTLLASRGRHRDPSVLTLTDTRTGEVVASYAATRCPRVVSKAALAFSADGTRVLTRATAGSETLLDLAGGRFVERVSIGEEPHETWPRLAAWLGRDAIRLGVVRDARGEWRAALQRDLGVVTGFADARAVTVWRHDEPSVVELPTGGARSVALRPASGDLALGLANGGVLVVDRTTGEERARFDGAHGSTTWGVAYSPDGRRLASGGNDGRVLIWDADDVAGGPLVALVAAEGSYAFMVEWSDDGSRLFATTGAGTTALWDAVPRDVRLREARQDASRGAVAAELLAGLFDTLDGDRVAVAAHLRASDDETSRAALRALATTSPDGLVGRVVEVVPSPADAWLAVAADAVDADRLASARRHLDAVPDDARDWLWRHLSARSPSSLDPHVAGVGLAHDGDREAFVTQTYTTLAARDLDGGTPRVMIDDVEAVGELCVRGRHAVVNVTRRDGSREVCLVDVFTGHELWAHPFEGPHYLSLATDEPVVLGIDVGDGLQLYDERGVVWRHEFRGAGLGFASLTRDGTRVLVQDTVSAGLRLSTLDASTGDVITTRTFDGGTLGAIGDTPNGEALIFAPPSGPMLELDPHDLSTVRELARVGSPAMGSLRVSDDGSRIAVPLKSGVVVVDRATDEVVFRLDAPGAWSKGRIALTRDGSHLAVVSPTGGELLPLDARQPVAVDAPLAALTTASDTPLTHPSDDLAVALLDGDDGRAAWFVRPSTGARVCRLHAAHELTAWGWSADGRVLAAQTASGDLLAWHDGALGPD